MVCFVVGPLPVSSSSPVVETHDPPCEQGLATLVAYQWLAYPCHTLRPEHRLAASCTSVEQDLHNPKASVKAGGSSSTVMNVGGHKKTREEAHLCLVFPLAS